MKKDVWNKKPRITRVCPCGRSFTFGEGELARRNPTYCCEACRRKYHAGSKKSKYKLPPEADKLIIKIYQEKVGMKSCKEENHPVRDLAKRLSVPRWKITRRATQLGLRAKKRKEPLWSDEELKILEKQARFSLETIQRKLKENGYRRSLCGIEIKKKRMRLAQNLKGQTVNSLTECFGVDSKTISRWIKLGYLKAQRRGTNRTNAQGGDMYWIKDTWIRDFIINNVDIIDLRKIDKYWFVDILAGKYFGTGPAKGGD